MVILIEFTLSFNTPSSASPLYVQLYEYLRNEIMCGRLEPRSKMPSARKLCQHLAISRNTVNAAYSQLQAEGYLESVSKSGYYVAHDIDAAFTGDFTDTHTPAHTPKPENDLKTYRYDFKHGKIDSANFPNHVLKKLMVRCLNDNTPDFATYGNTQGEYALRSEIVKYIRNCRGVKCIPEQIVITSGTQHALDLICKLIRDEHSAIAVEEPGYIGGKAVFQLNGFETIPVELDSGGIRVEALRASKVGAVLVTPSHQFPNGIIMPPSKRVALLRWAEENDGLIIENDYEGEFSYSGKPIPCLQSFDANDRVIYLYSFSNSIFPSIRTSFFVLPSRLMHKYSSFLGLLEQTVPTMVQNTLTLFLSEGHMERHIRRIKKFYSKKYSVLIEAIKRHMTENVEIISNSAGLHVLLRVNNGMSETELLESAGNSGVRVYSSSQYWLSRKSVSESLVMLGFGTMNEQDIVEGIVALNNAWFT